MVSWKPISGIIPPLNEVQWQEEFSAYQKTPEFIQRNYHFTLNEFKNIFWWEYIHRLLGRLLAFLFIIPFIFFWRKGYFKDSSLRNKILILFVLGALQGVIGWLMVKSGLSKEPHVSHIRLAIHLSMAFILISYLLYLIFPIQYRAHHSFNPNKIKYKKHLIILYLIFFVQIFYGALVAGLKAGYLYGTFPLMGDEWVPEIIFERLHIDGLASLINYGPAVQFTHRLIGLIFTSYLIYLVIKVNKTEHLLHSLKKALHVLLFLTISQVVLGVCTILWSVPFCVAVIHQAMAVLLCAWTVKSFFHANYSRNHSR